MNLFRTFSWMLMLGATALAGPNIPAQILAAVREATGLLSRRIRLRGGQPMP
jgi:hypothetical protein